MTPAALAPSLAAHFKNRPARQLTPFLQCERAAVLSEQDSMKIRLAGFLWFAVESYRSRDVGCAALVIAAGTGSQKLIDAGPQ